MAKGDYQGYADRTGYIGGSFGAERRAAFVALAQREGISVTKAIARLVDRAVAEDALPSEQMNEEDRQCHGS